MDEAKLAEIEARASAATPGPWRASTGRTHDPSTGRVTSVEHWISRGDDDVGITGDVSDSRTGEPSLANAAFIAHARADVPALVAEVRRVGAENAMLRSATDAAVDGVRATLPAALEIARREGAEAMLARCRAVAREAFDSHPLTLDSRHEPGCICYAIGRGSCSECDRGDAVVDALDALPLVAPAAAPANGGVS